MANPYYDNLLKKYEESTTNNTTYSNSRYHALKRVIDDELDEYIELAEPINVRVSDADSYYSVEPAYANRLDLISYKFYNTPQLYWVIAEANDIIDPQNIEAGTVLRIPSRQVIYGTKGLLR